MSDEHQLTSPGSTGGGGGSVCGASPAPPASLPPDDALSAAADGRALPASRPSAAYVPVRRWLVSEATGLRTLRADLREQLAASVVTPGDHDGRDDVILVTSELATNALAHGRSPAHVQLLLDGHAVLVVVSDGDPTHAPFLAERREPGEGGFGLQIARRLADDVGWWSDASGKHVWAAFAAEPTT